MSSCYRPVYFWNGPFSNWHNSTFEESDGTVYYNNEQYMMRYKALLFQDSNSESKIMNETCPKIIKQYGRQVKNFNSEIWNVHAKNIVTDGCYLKFSQNPNLKEFILSTGYRPIIEASPYDNIWGIGLNEQTARITPIDNWPGTNWLGECLMRTREKLRLENLRLEN